MDDKKRDQKIEISFGIILILFSLLTWIIYFFQGGIALLLMGIFSSLLAIASVTRPIKNLRIIKFYDFLFGWIMGILYIVSIIGISFILVFMSIFLLWVSLTGVFKGITWLLNFYHIFEIDWNEANKPIFYCSTLSTVVLLSYFGEKIILILNRLLKYGSSSTVGIETSKSLALLLNKYIDYRQRCYQISIGLYIFSVIEKLSNANLITYPLWMSYKSVALEVLLSFVAIDSYVQNYSKKKNI